MRITRGGKQSRGRAPRPFSGPHKNYDRVGGGKQGHWRGQNKLTGGAKWHVHVHQKAMGKGYKLPSQKARRNEEEGLPKQLGGGAKTN